MHVSLAGDRGRTTFAETPSFHFPLGDDAAAVMEFPSSAHGVAGGGWITQVRFPRVIELRFVAFDIGMRLEDWAATRFGLLELTNSFLLHRFHQSGALSRPGSPVVTPGDVHHYRIAFDNHGTYDVLSMECRVKSWYQDRPQEPRW